MSAAPVYRRSGRGGAGNYFPQSQPATSATTVDLEAQTPPTTPAQISSNTPTAGPSLPTTTTTSHLPVDSTIDVSTGTIVDRKYQTAGRGGAGNWYDTSIISSDGTHNSDINGTSSSSSNSGADPHPYSKSNAEYKQTRTYGRGGTGNWEVSEQMRLKKEKEEKEIEMKVISGSSSSNNNNKDDPVITLPDVAHVRAPLQEVEVERLEV